MTDITVTADFYAIRVHINGVLHLHVDRRKLLAVHAWFDHETSYSIEWVLIGGMMVTEYTERARWESVLKQVEGLL